MKLTELQLELDFAKYTRSGENIDEKPFYTRTTIRDNDMSSIEFFDPVLNSQGKQIVIIVFGPPVQSSRHEN